MCFGGVWEGLPLAKLHKRPVCGEALHTRVFCGVFEGLLLLLCWRLSDSFSHSSHVCISLKVSPNSHSEPVALSSPLLVQVAMVLVLFQSRRLQMSADVSSCLQMVSSCTQLAPDDLQWSRQAASSEASPGFCNDALSLRSGKAALLPLICCNLL